MYNILYKLYLLYVYMRTSTRPHRFQSDAAVYATHFTILPLQLVRLTGDPHSKQDLTGELAHKPTTISKSLAKTPFCGSLNGDGGNCGVVSSS